MFPFPLLISLPIISMFFFFFIFKFTSDKTLKIPKSYGPQSYPIIGSLIPFFNNRRRLLNWYTELLTASPTATASVTVGSRRVILTANPSNVRHILKTSFNNYPKGTPFTDLLGDLLGAGIFNSDGPAWAAQRKLASHEFSVRSLRGLVFQSIKDVVETRLVPLLQRAADDNAIVDLQDLLKRFGFDVVCRISLGFDPVCLDLNRPVPELVKAFDIAAEISAGRAAEPVNAVWKVKRFLNVGTERKLNAAIRTVHVSVSEIIRDKKKSLGSDLLSRFLLAGSDDVAVRDMIISFIMAGRDTTSAAMTWLFWLISQNDDVTSRIIKEVNALVNEAGFLDFDDLKEMNYTKACLCESMRLYPPVAWDSKHAVNDDVMPDGTRVRRGDRVTYMPYAMGRMEMIWGKDWAEFKPDRWFEEKTGVDEEVNRRVMKAVDPYEFPVFQAGPRVCLGKEMAFVQMKYVVGSVLREFEIEPVNANRPVFVPRLTAHMDGGFKVRVKRRKSGTNQ